MEWKLDRDFGMGCAPMYVIQGFKQIKEGKCNTMDFPSARVT